MTPLTVLAVKLASTHWVIALEPLPPGATTRAAAGDEVVDLAVGDVLLELRQRRARVAAVEAADRHHRLPARQLVARGGVGADRRRRPGVGVGVGLQQRGDGCRRRAAVEQAADAALATPGRRPACGAGRAGGRCLGGALERRRRGIRLAGPCPPGPPPAEAGPALGIEPVCGVVAVFTAYAAGPAKRGHQGEHGGGEADAARQVTGDRDAEAGDEADDQDEPAQPGQEVGGAAEEVPARAPRSSSTVKPSTDVASSEDAVSPEQPASRCRRAQRRPGPGRRCSRRGRSRP